MHGSRAGNPVDTFALTERTASDCALTPEDVAFLLSAHRPHIELVPAGQPDLYRLTPTGHVGTIVAPSCRLVIRPKIPLENVFYLLDPTGPLPFVADRTTTLSGDEALDFLAARLARLLDERARAGLHRAYAERAEQGPFLHGRLDVAAQVREAGCRKDQLSCRYDDFTSDVPCNQVSRATAELVLRSPLLGETVRVALRRALQPFDAITPVLLGPDSFAALSDRLTASYVPLLELCRLLADGLGPGASAGATPCPAFLINMERTFEQYVARGLVRAFASCARRTVSTQHAHVASRAVAGQADLVLRPDITIDRNGWPVVVVDTKWKRLRGSPMVTEDVYQVLAYAIGLGVRRTVLVYPGRRDRVWSYPLARAPIEVEIRTLRVVGPREACERSLRRLARALRRGGRR